MNARDEFERRRLESLTQQELNKEIAAKDSATTKAMFWFIMFVFSFVFPWICVPIIVIGIVHAIYKANTEDEAVVETPAVQKTDETYKTHWPNMSSKKD